MSVKKSKATVNFKKNRLYITIADTLSTKEIDSLYTEIRFCVADLKPGFDTITDLSACSLGVLSGIPTFRKISNHLIASKVGRVVRVIDETKVIQKQLLNYAARSQGYRADIFHSLEAAEEYLSSGDQNAALSFILHMQAVAYTENGQSGEGIIKILSVEGCDIYRATLIPQQGAEVSLTIQFEAHEDISARFELGAAVTWVEDHSFGVLFAEIDGELKDKLWKRLVHESQCELSSNFPDS